MPNKNFVFVGVFVAFLFFTTGSALFGAVDCGTMTNVGGICVPTTASTGLSDKPVLNIVQTFLMWLLGILGFVAILAFVISGMQYLTSAGDEDMIETAKRNIKYSLIGLFVALSGWVIIKAIDSLMNASTNF